MASLRAQHMSYRKWRLGRGFSQPRGWHERKSTQKVVFSIPLVLLSSYLILSIFQYGGFWIDSLAIVVLSLGLQAYYWIKIFNGVYVFASMGLYLGFIWPVANVVAFGQRLAGMHAESNWFLPFFSFGDAISAILTPLFWPILLGFGGFHGALDASSDAVKPQCKYVYEAAEAAGLSRSELKFGLWKHRDVLADAYYNNIFLEWRELTRSRRKVYDLNLTAITGPAYWVTRVTSAFGCVPSDADIDAKK